MRLRSIWHVSESGFFVIDYVLLAVAVWISHHMTPWSSALFAGTAGSSPAQSLIAFGLPLCMSLGAYVSGTQRMRVGSSVTRTLTASMVGLGGGMLVFVVLYALARYGLVGRYILIISYLLGNCFLFGFRLLVSRNAKRELRLILMCSTEEVYNRYSDAVKQLGLPLALQHCLATDLVGAGFNGPLTRGGSSSTTEVVVDPAALPAGVEKRLTTWVADGVTVFDRATFSELYFDRVDIEAAGERWLWTLDPIHSSPYFFLFKRTFDIVASLVGFAVCLPWIPLIALAIYLQDRGPVLYAQTRVGLYNRPFRIWKLRTMRVDAEASGAQWARARDDRVTLIGKILRRTRIDEVPQFWNILRGDMSFIGPRPERPGFVEVIEQQMNVYRCRHMVKPGLTGWAQINYRYGASIEDAKIKLSYDLYYIKKASVAIDVLILLRTIVAMVKGAR